MAKERRKQAAVVQILAANMRVVFAMADRVPELRDRSTPERLCEWIDEQNWGDRIGKTTVYKMLNGDGPVVIDQLELVARAFEMEAWHLLTPSLDPANPPYLVRTEQERELWESINRYKEVEREEATKRQNAGSHGDPAGDAEGEGKLQSDAGSDASRKRGERTAHPAEK